MEGKVRKGVSIRTGKRWSFVLLNCSSSILVSLLLCYLEGALIILDEDDLGQLSQDDIEAISDIVNTAVEFVRIQVHKLC